MKKVLLAALTAAMVLAGCGQVAESGDKIADYFPKKYNSYYEYSMTGHSIEDQKTYANYISDNRMQRITSAGTLTMTEVLEFGDGELLYVGGYGSYCFNDISAMEQIEYALVIKEPLKKGTKWQQDAATESEITNMAAEIETPMGSYTAMEITNTTHRSATEQQLEVSYISKEYYVKGIGLVKSDTYMSGAETPTVTMELSKLTEKTSIQFPINLFYPSGGLLSAEEHILTVKTNMDFYEWLENEMKNPSDSGFTPLLTPNAKINKLAYNEADSIVSLDVSKHFIDELPADADTESAMLKGIAYTLGYLYQAENIEILIDGKNYESGNLSIGTGEYIKVE